MARYRLLPTAEQAEVLNEHCRHARYVWNLAVEQRLHWQPGLRAPGYNEQCAQLTAARFEHDWLAAGSQTVQQQALRDFAQAMRNFFNGTHRRPTWRKVGVHEGFRQVGVKTHHIERLNRRIGRIWVPKIGWVRFTLSLPFPFFFYSYLFSLYLSFLSLISFSLFPFPFSFPIFFTFFLFFLGVVVSAALSTGELLHAPTLIWGEAKRLKVLQQRLALAERGSLRRGRTKLAIAKLKARRRPAQDWVEKATTLIARRFDTIRIEALDVRAMTRSARGTVEQPGQRVAQKRGLNRGYQPQRMRCVRRAFAGQGFRSGRGDPGRVHVGLDRRRHDLGRYQAPLVQTIATRRDSFRP